MHSRLGFHRDDDLGCLRPVSERAVGPFRVVVLAPAFHDELSLSKRLEEFPVQQLILEAPHWYLPAMGVDAICQGEGIGSSLLEFSLGRYRRPCGLAYLESRDPANIPFYRRHGIEVVGEIRIHGSPVLTRMLCSTA